MIRNIIKYPDPMVRLISANVRFFNDELQDWIADMVDTMKEYDLEALSAILIGIQYNIMVVKEDDIYTPYINGRFIKHAGKVTATERSIYYEGISVDVERYERITLIYEDEHGAPQSKDLEGEKARLFQHYLDYCFGSTFVDRVDKEVKERINNHLEFGLVKDSSGGACPTVFYRDYFKRAAKYIMIAVLLTFAIPFFASKEVSHKVYMVDKYTLALIPMLIISYFLYAQYESRKFKQCTSCQTGNIIGVATILFVQFLIVSIGVFWWVGR